MAIKKAEMRYESLLTSRSGCWLRQLEIIHLIVKLRSRARSGEGNEKVKLGLGRSEKGLGPELYQFILFFFNIEYGCLSVDLSSTTNFWTLALFM